MRATDIATATAFSAPAPSALSASALVACQADASEQEQIASAFVSAAIRLSRDLPTDRADHLPYIGPDRPPHLGPALSPPYVGRHRRGSITVRFGSELQAAQS